MFPPLSCPGTGPAGHGYHQLPDKTHSSREALEAAVLSPGSIWKNLLSLAAGPRHRAWSTGQNRGLQSRLVPCMSPCPVQGHTASTLPHHGSLFSGWVSRTTHHP